ncbi:MAG TPA: hypothetical protein VHB25_17515 [Gemmatimonadaceae bacterium]|nr:hypothetical protein [Gemmatimonadaceae bacterium]
MTNPDDGLRRFEAALGAISKMTGEGEEPGLGDARCPKCGASNFVSAPDLFTEALVRLEEPSANASIEHVPGFTDARIVTRFKPPRRKSAMGRVLVVGIPLAAAVYYVFHRYGSTLGQLAAMAAIVITIVVLMTTLRRNSDDYYDRRQQWRKLHVCRNCGQLVAG